MRAVTHAHNRTVGLRKLTALSTDKFLHLFVENITFWLCIYMSILFPNLRTMPQSRTKTEGPALYTALDCKNSVNHADRSV